jgi:proline dehydrogenase
MGPLKQLRSAAARCAQPIVRQAARRYIAGPELADAMDVAATLAQSGHSTTLGFWDGTEDTPAGIQQHYLANLEAIAHGGLACYESIKLPALREQPELLEPVIDASISLGIRIHFDSLGVEAADAMWLAAAGARARGASVSGTIPGRWLRSADDALRAAARGIFVRVVKGQWADPEAPTLDPRTGFMNVVESLAGRAELVAVATHDLELGRQAIERLQAAGTACEWELLYGLPSRAILPVARELQVPVRFYVPYGHAYLPYCLAQAKRNPRLLGQLMLDACRSALAGN